MQAQEPKIAIAWKHLCQEVWLHYCSPTNAKDNRIRKMQGWKGPQSPLTEASQAQRRGQVVMTPKVGWQDGKADRGGEPVNQEEPVQEQGNVIKRSKRVKKFQP
ncbi:hypothetical protein BTVI_68661 [Pitangus sulphuratus]|nr:hypothetical protein BTVI_68661 [Pitangus sulphuratus]